MPPFDAALITFTLSTIPGEGDAALLAELERVADGAAGRAGRDEVPVEAIPPEKLISRPPHGALSDTF